MVQPSDLHKDQSEVTTFALPTSVDNYSDEWKLYAIIAGSAGVVILLLTIIGGRKAYLSSSSTSEEQQPLTKENVEQRY